MSQSTAALISARNATHGDAYPQMATTGRLWGAYLLALGWTPPNGGLPVLSADQADMIMVLNKISRSAHGDAAFADHYDDVLGYITLAKDHASRPVDG